MKGKGRAERQGPRKPREGGNTVDLPTPKLSKAD